MELLHILGNIFGIVLILFGIGVQPADNGNLVSIGIGALLLYF